MVLEETGIGIGWRNWISALFNTHVFFNQDTVERRAFRFHLSCKRSEAGRPPGGRFCLSSSWTAWLGFLTRRCMQGCWALLEVCDRLSESHCMPTMQCFSSTPHPRTLVLSRYCFQIFLAGTSLHANFHKSGSPLYATRKSMSNLSCMVLTAR